MHKLTDFKVCRKGLHQYPLNLRQCPECRKIAKEKWYKNNKELCKTFRKTWNEKNKQQRNKLNQKWKQNNKNKINAINSKRRANKRKAVPAWADLKEIFKIYQEAVELTKKTGVKHEVDHIYPLQNKYMCGLHVQENLQILTKKENLAKGNRTWPGQLDCQRE
jgi:negative regulator of genetic competence, sporulation and motility